MFPRNPENEALRLPQPVRGAAPPRVPTDAELLGTCALVCVYFHVCSVHAGVCKHCVSVCTSAACDCVCTCV